MATISREAACEVLRRIREDNGWISQEDRAASPPATLRALENVRRKLGAATKTLATNLYSKDTRFVYELIQNAEDNNYNQAESDGVDLYLSFSIYPDRIVLESNEDGFLEEHVRAICSTGESTKTVAQGYIGEKGIGFKSVFKVGKKVHIQSEPFSFSFEHTRDSSDDGLGMVTPLDEDYDDLPEGVRTRITLTLLDPSTFEQRAQDLLSLPDTLLLFLIKLNKLHINIYPEHGSATEITYDHLDNEDDDNLEMIIKTTTLDGESSELCQDFYVVRKEIENLPRDEARRNTSQATVVLAFPVDEEYEPIIKQQHVFAFLPLRCVGFTFLIQSDFITQASREDVFHSARNENLLSGVAETFRDAVLKFCDHPALQYQWMRYLPNDSISDEFWKTLRPKIISLLSNTCCLRPWSETSLRLPRQLYRVNSDFIDQNGEPLFPDLEEEAYLSQHYLTGDFKNLRSLGAHRPDFSILIARIRSDLRRADSKMKAIATDEDWHTRAAETLSKILTKSIGSPIESSLKALDLIPLQDNRWVSAKTSPIFLPDTMDVPIPTDLGLHLVQSAAVLNAARKDLFLQFGVKRARPRDIISLIIGKYDRNFPITRDNISHLKYLYWNLPKDAVALEEKIFLKDRETNPVYRTPNRLVYMYFREEEEEYGPCQLFQMAPSASPDAPGLGVHFLNSAYLDSVPAEVLHHGRSWKNWLTAFAGVQSCPQLQHPRLPRLSDEFRYIMQHRPANLVGLLKRFWPLYEPQMNAAIVRELAKCCVPSDGELADTLDETFLPLPRLKAIVERLQIDSFPFLAMPEELTDEDENEWQFLKRFGVKFNGGSDSLHFYVEALGRIADENENECSPGCLGALFAVYGDIARNCSNSDDVAYICNYFETHEVIYIPPSAGQAGEWVDSEACVWTAPEWLESRKRLDGVSNFATCKHLFCVILKIGDANWKDYLMDLETLKEHNRSNTGRVTDIYRRLWREFEQDSIWETIRNSFEESELVYLPLQNTWHPLSSCIWAEDHIRMPRKVPIKNPYTTLEDFFCRILNVRKPNLDMHVQALKELARSWPARSASEIKQSLMIISSMDPTEDDVRDLRRSNIFAVRTTNGHISFTDTTADFAIVDRSEYGIAFAGKINLLDYSIAEVRACRSLLLALGLERQNLSELVGEVTTVEDGVMNTELTLSFRLKAYALFRCTVHYHSPKSRDGDRSLYNQLLEAFIYVSDGIYKSVSVVQYGKTITVENSRANFHLDDSNHQLRLYVPRDENSQEECFFRQLPRRLMAYFAISDPTAEALLNGIIGCRSLIAVDGILKDAGIVEVDGMERPSEYDQIIHQSDNEGASHDDITTESLTSQTPQSRRSTPVSTTGTIHNARNRREHSANVPGGSPSSNGQSSASPVPPFSPSWPSEFPIPLVDNAILETGYASLLERVINSAGRMMIPERRSHSVDADVQGATGNALFESVFATRSAERDRKVGAAGELLIFEILLNLGLPGFSRNNWKSTIRKEVRVHNRYRDLLPWEGRETADITYDDIHSDLTELLIDKGYLERGTWEDARPKYYLEVKTTTKDWSEQFYMSKSQYERMSSMKLEPRTAASNIYVIFRVFNLEGRIGLRVYVDPESSRLNGDLQFNVDTWAVRPAGNLLN